MATSPLARLRRVATTLLASALATAAVIGSAGAAEAGELGIDVSRWQHGGTLDWAAVKADEIGGHYVRFAFIKATEGSYYTNSYFDSDWQRTREVGIYHGAYHFARPSVGSARSQARYFVGVAGKAGTRGDLPPVLDLEDDGDLSDSQLQTWVKTWLRNVKQLTGRTPIIYVSPYFWESEMGNSAAFTSYPLWVAHYGAASPRVPGGWDTWTFWQGSSTGSVQGIGGNVDMNAFNGSLAKLKRLANIPARTHETAEDVPEEPATSAAPARPRTRTSIDANRNAVYRGRPVRLTGTVATRAGDAVGRKRVLLSRRTDESGPWRRIDSVRTDADGHYAFRTSVREAAAYRVILRRKPDYRRSVSPVADVSLRPKVRLRPELASQDDRVRSGRRIRLYGHLETAQGSAVADRSVRVYKRAEGSTSWTLVGRGTSVAPTGWYQVYIRPRESATYKAVASRGLRYRKGVSNLVTVTVR